MDPSFEPVNALELFGPELGAGVVAVPGMNSAAMIDLAAGIALHVESHRRIALLSCNVGDDDNAYTSAADTLVAAVGSAGSATAHYIVLVNETGASQSSLIGPVIDTATGLPFLPNGGDINIVWDDGANKIFKL